MGDVLVDDHLPKASHGRVDSGQLDENVSAVLIISTIFFTF